MNDWAHALFQWETRVRAMCGILQIATGVTPEQFDRLLTSICNEKHNPDDFRKALRVRDIRLGGFIPASDVLGHPPNPPFDDASLT